MIPKKYEFKPIDNGEIYPDFEQCCSVFKYHLLNNDPNKISSYNVQIYKYYQKKYACIFTDDLYNLQEFIIVYPNDFDFSDKELEKQMWCNLLRHHFLYINNTYGGFGFSFLTDRWLQVLLVRYIFFSGGHYSEEFFEAFCNAIEDYFKFKAGSDSARVFQEYVEKFLNASSKEEALEEAFTVTQRYVYGIKDIYIKEELVEEILNSIIVEDEFFKRNISNILPKVKILDSGLISGTDYSYKKFCF